MSYADALKAVQELGRQVDTLAALGALLSGRAGQAGPDDAIMGCLEAVKDAIDPALLEGITAEEARFLHAIVRASLRRALELAESPDRPPRWGFDDEVILQTQGKSSRIVTRMIADYASRNPELGQRLDAPARFLDVGSGAGWISISMAEEWPSLQVDGIDILTPALAIARENLAGTSAGHRIRFRECDVADLDESNAYAAAFIPAIFIPEAVLHAALPALCRAIENDGWLFLAIYRAPEAALAKALSALQTTLSGGRPWTEQEAAGLLAEYGFEFLEDIGTGYPIHLLAARRP